MKMKKSRILLLVVLLVTLGMYFMYVEGSLPVDKNNGGSTIFVIQKGDGLFSVAKKLAAEDLIRNKIIYF